MVITGRSHRLLIVEDDPFTMSALKSLASLAGQEVETATTVLDALAKIPCCDRILLDLNLPDGYGTTVLQRVRDERWPTKVAIMTGTSDDTLLAEARALGPDAIFRKPADVMPLIKWLAAD